MLNGSFTVLINDISMELVQTTNHSYKSRIFLLLFTSFTELCNVEQLMLPCPLSQKARQRDKKSRTASKSRHENMVKPVKPVYSGIFLKRKVFKGENLSYTESFSCHFRFPSQ